MSLPSRSRRLTLACAVLSTISLGCHTLAGEERRWSSVETAHFIVHTDLAQRDAEAQALDMESLLSAMHKTGWDATGDFPLRLHVVIFADEEEFRSYAGERLDGYMLDDVLFEPWVVIPRSTRLTGRETLAHELTHFMAFQAIQHQPRWFAEGLASYFQTARYADDDVFELGHVPLDSHQSLHDDNYIPPSQLVSGNARVDDSGFYPSSWLLVHYLMTKRPEEFVQFQTYLAQGMADERAFQRAFPITPQALDAAVHEYLVVGDYEVFGFQVPRGAVKRGVATRPMSRADEHSLRALLWARAPREAQPARAHDDVMNALALEPDHLQAAVQRLFEAPNHPDTFEAAKKLTQRHPNAWLAWVALGVSALANNRYAELVGSPATDPGANAPRLAPNQPFAVMMGALSAFSRGERGDALAYAARAERLQPTNAGILAIRADMLAQLGECAALSESVTRLRDLAHGRLAAKDFARLDAARKACQ